jgi:ATP-dependent DNA helicase RecG
MSPDTSVAVLPFVGPKYQQLLSNLGIASVRDVLYHLPTRYLDLSKITPIDQVALEELQVVQAQVESIKKVRLRGGKVLITVLVSDDSGSLQLSWFNQPFIEKALVVGQTYRFAGEVEHKFGHDQMTNPTSELASKPPVHTGRLVPIYAQTAGISSKWLRARIAPLLPKTEAIIPDFLPSQIISDYQLLPLPQAIIQLHAPEDIAQAQNARRRLAFDELLLLQLAGLLRKQSWQEGRQAPELVVTNSQLAVWTSILPFDLTDAQKQVLKEILEDMSNVTPMNRLLEGDVGSGKTVVAFLAALVAVDNGFQVAVMAPTSVLAQQHFLTFQSLLDKLEASSLQSPRKEPVTLALRTSKSKSQPADITIGTHALITEGLDFDKLGFIIIDEQHRFGVEQRAQLMAKSQSGVHVLSMTATPIPRTLALTIYSDLSLSIIDQLPSNRLPIRTHVVPQPKRADMEGFLRTAMERGEQVFIVCPLIDTSETLTEVRAATAEFERLQKVFKKQKLALLHGRMKAADKDATLAAFKDHHFDALVATPVVEVGIDVPNATILVIEGAERFGLAQLHQLRGRVGRGALQSYCFLLSDATDVKEVNRLRQVEQEHSGIKLAELDLTTRGPGEVYGHRQSGIPELKAASLTDIKLLQLSRQAAQQLLDTHQLERLPALQQELSLVQRLVAAN